MPTPNCVCGFPIITKTFPFFCQCGEKWNQDRGSVAEKPEGTSPLTLATTAAAYNHWRSLHQFAPDNRDSWDSAAAKRFVCTWLKGIPNQGCNCWENFQPILRLLPPAYETPEQFLHRSWMWHDAVSEKIGKPRVSWDDALAKWWFKVETLITWSQFTEDTLELANIILDRHPRVGGIAGCPRSGMRVASEIAIRLGLPLYEATAEHGLRQCGSGVRMRDDAVHGPRQSFGDGEIVVVEDSTCSGFSVIELRSNPELAKLPIYAVYGASPGKGRVDGYAVHHELPHWFEWNLWNNGQILKDFNAAIDWDGILNEDCLPDDDDDGPHYRRWLESVEPIRTPRAYQVPFIITARREAYREIAEAWLAKYKINYGQLIMFPGTFEERARTCIGTWKAEQASQIGARMFIESDSEQARIISASTSACRVLCPPK